MFQCGYYINVFTDSAVVIVELADRYQDIYTHMRATFHFELFIAYKLNPDNSISDIPSFAFVISRVTSRILFNPQ